MTNLVALCMQICGQLACIRVCSRRGTSSCMQAHKLQESGKAMLVDVRATWNHEREHIEDDVSLPLFRGVEGKTAFDTIKRLVMTIGFAMKATGVACMNCESLEPESACRTDVRLSPLSSCLAADSAALASIAQAPEVYYELKRCWCAERDPAFRQKAKEQLGDTKKTLILYCGLGGTLKIGASPYGPNGRKSYPGDPERAFGRESRSLKGCYELLEVCLSASMSFLKARCHACLQDVHQAGVSHHVSLSLHPAFWQAYRAYT